MNIRDNGRVQVITCVGGVGEVEAGGSGSRGGGGAEASERA